VDKVEIARLFKKIKRFFPAFDASIEAVNEAYRYLNDIPFELADQNVDRHIRNEKYPPTIAEIRAGRQDPEISTIPGVEETRKMLAEMERWRETAVPCPDHIREEMRRLARRVARKPSPSA
jgi:hypothetical protein